MHKVHRYHDFSAGHRVVGHENKCRFLHGHNYRVHFTCASDLQNLDSVGRVIDFGIMKSTLCQWLEDNWDHTMIIWEEDPMFCSVDRLIDDWTMESICFVPFNPTAENMAEHLVTVVGPQLLGGTGVQLIEVKIEETRKCFASYAL